MKTVRDMQDIYLQTKSKFDRQVTEFQKNFYAPVFETYKAQFWKSIPQDVKAELQSQKPDVVKRLDERYTSAGGKNGRTGS